MSSEDDSVNGEIDEIDLEVIQEDGDIEFQNQEEVEVNAEEQNAENSENPESQEKTVIKPKRVIKNPQPKLNEQTLQGPKGLTAIQSHFDNVTFKGRGQEEHDLNLLMKTYEYWCHRLIPKFSFDDCIARLETLGSKRATQTHIKRIRMDLIVENPDKPITSDEEENHIGDASTDQFEQLVTNTATSQSEQELTEEQMEKIRQNRDKALRLREERMGKIREKAQNSLEQSNQLPTQNQQRIADNSNEIIEVVEHTSQTNGEKEKEDEEDQIDNILDIINSDDQKVQALASEDETDTENTGLRKNRRRIIDSDEENEDEETLDLSNGKNRIENNLLQINENEAVEVSNDIIHKDNKIVANEKISNLTREEIENSDSGDTQQNINRYDVDSPEHDIESILNDINTDMVETNVDGIDTSVVQNIGEHDDIINNIKLPNTLSAIENKSSVEYPEMMDISLSANRIAVNGNVAANTGSEFEDVGCEPGWVEKDMNAAEKINTDSNNKVQSMESEKREITNKEAIVGIIESMDITD